MPNAAFLSPPGAAPTPPGPPPGDAPPPARSGLLPAMLLAGVGLPCIVALKLAGAGDPSDRYVVVAPPISGSRAVIGIIIEAGGGVVSTGTLPGTALAFSDDPAFPAMARAKGAWLVSPTEAFTGCDISTRANSNDG